LKLSDLGVTKQQSSRWLSSAQNIFRFNNFKPARSSKTRVRRRDEPARNSKLSPCQAYGGDRRGGQRNADPRRPVPSSIAITREGRSALGWPAMTQPWPLVRVLLCATQRVFALFAR
jgi:hypothetical protein